MKKSVESMQDPKELPLIVPLFEVDPEDETSVLYHDAIKNILKKILPHNLRIVDENDPDAIDDQSKEFEAMLPYLSHTSFGNAPANISFFVLAKYRANAFKFFFEMISNWLVPGHRLTVSLFFAVDFSIPIFSDDVFTLCEVRVNVANEKQLEQLRSNLPIIEKEIRLGIRSSYYARRILEIKGLSADAKTALIQEHITNLIPHFPRFFDYDLLTEMQHVLVTCKDEFKAERECRHIGRIIAAHYYFRKNLSELSKKEPTKHHLKLKLFRATLLGSSLNRAVVGVAVGINFLQENEVFEERHLISAIQNYIPTAQAVENSFFSNRRGEENVCTLYVELEKSNGDRFTSDEIRLLQQELPINLKDRIEHLMNPIFMPRNEEEIMRNILSLSNQIKYLHDLPQVIISFDRQTHSDLFFNVILVHIRKPGSLTIRELFKKAKGPLEYIHDRSKDVGLIRKTYPKEANVFGVKLPKDQYLRRDHSIDLNKARQFVMMELTRIVGDVRDFNGGMISKQHELLSSLREQLNGIKYDDLLLENFFYSLTPDAMRTVLDPSYLKTLFMFMLDCFNVNYCRGDKFAFKIRSHDDKLYIMVKADDRGIKEYINRSINKFNHKGARLATSFAIVNDVAYVGYLYLCDNMDQQEAFSYLIQKCLLLRDPKPSCSLYQSILRDDDD